MKQVLLFLLVFLTVSSFAQKHFLGFKSGVNVSNINSDILDDSKFSPSFSAALTYDFQFKNHFLLGTALQYEQLGFKSKIIYFPEKMDFVLADLKSVSNYIAIPLKLGYSFGEKWKGIVYLGVQTSYLLKSNNYFSYLNIEDKNNFTNDMKKYDFAGILELETRYMLSDRINVFLNFGFLHSLVDFNKESDYEIYNYRFNLSLGMKYSLKPTD